MDLLFSQSGRSLTIAHGGALDMTRANSLDGISESLDSGVDAIEVDVQATRDRKLVLFHDASVCINDKRVQVCRLSLEELERIEPRGKWLGVTRLEDVLSRLRKTRTLVVLDIKTRNIIDDVIKLVHEMNISNKALIASFDYLPLKRARQLSPGTPIVVTIGLSRAIKHPLGLLWTLLAFLFPVFAASSINADAILCPANRLSHSLVRTAHRKQIAVFVWRIESRMREKQVATFGVDGIVTDWLGRAGDRTQTLRHV